MPLNVESSAAATQFRSFTRARGPGGRPITRAEDYAAFNEAFAASRIESVVIHAVYLINTATPDPVIREKSLSSLTHALRLGDAIGADGVVLHAGSRKKDPVDEAIARSGEVVREALAESEKCRVLFENTAGTQGPLGRDFSELTQPGRCRRGRRADRHLPRLLPPLRLRLRHRRAGRADHGGR